MVRHDLISCQPFLTQLSDGSVPQQISAPVRCRKPYTRCIPPHFACGSGSSVAPYEGRGPIEWCAAQSITFHPFLTQDGPCRNPSSATLCAHRVPELERGPWIVQEPYTRTCSTSNPFRLPYVWTRIVEYPLPCVGVVSRSTYDVLSPTPGLPASTPRIFLVAPRECVLANCLFELLQ